MKKKGKECIEFGKRVRKLRLKNKLTQEEMAEKVGIHWTYVGGIERGERNPTLMMTVRIAKALQVAPARLLKIK